METIGQAPPTLESLSAVPSKKAVSTGVQKESIVNNIKDYHATNFMLKGFNVTIGKMPAVMALSLIEDLREGLNGRVDFSVLKGMEVTETDDGSVSPETLGVFFQIITAIPKKLSEDARNKMFRYVVVETGQDGNSAPVPLDMNGLNLLGDKLELDGLIQLYMRCLVVNFTSFFSRIFSGEK